MAEESPNICRYFTGKIVMDNVHRFAGDCRIGKVPQRQYKSEIISKVKGEKSLGVSDGFQSRRTEMCVRGKPHLMQGRTSF
jgi:hypothetical protein